MKEFTTRKEVLKALRNGYKITISIGECLSIFMQKKDFIQEMSRIEGDFIVDYEGDKSYVFYQDSIIYWRPFITWGNLKDD